MKNFDPIQIRKDFPIYSNIENPFVYIDNAATTQRPSIVLNELNKYYTQFNANVHRAIYTIGEQATQAYENARGKIAKFIGADNSSIIFTRGTTESINLVAYAWARNNLSPNDEILVTEMEHHSNLVPWQLAAKATGAKLKYIPLNDDGTYKEWARDLEVRENLQESVMYTYYTFYGIILTLAFLILSVL